MKFKLVLAFAIPLLFVFKSAFAIGFYSDKTINSEVNESQEFREDNLTLEITSGGHLLIGDAIAITNYTHNQSKILVDSKDSEKGIFANRTAIEFDASSDGFLELLSGSIKNASNYSAIESLDSSINITTSAGTFIGNHGTSVVGEAVYTGSAAINFVNSSLSLSNAGTIFGPQAIILMSGSSGTIINSGSISQDYSDWNSIKLLDTSTAEIGNSGTITGGISAQTGEIDITNTGTIIGNIVLGTNSSSSVTLGGGKIVGNITNSNASQVFNINGGSYAGAVNGASTAMGVVNVKSGADFTLASDSAFGSSVGVNSVNISNNSNLIANGTIKAENLNIESGSTLKIASNNLTGNATLVEGIMDFGNTAHTFTGNISGGATGGEVVLGNAAHNITGDLTLNNSNTLSVTFAPLKSVGSVTTSGAATIDADTKIAVTIGAAYSYIVSGSKYKIVDGSTGSSVSKVLSDNINVNDSGSNTGFSILTFTSNVYDDDDLYLEIDRIGAIAATKSPNAQNVYSDVGVIGSAATGNLLLFQAYLDSSSSSSDLTAALKSATPQADDGIRQTSLNILNSSSRNIENRLDQIRLNQVHGPDSEKVVNFGSTTELAVVKHSSSKTAYSNSKADETANSELVAQPEKIAPSDSEADYLNSKIAYNNAEAKFLESKANYVKLQNEYLTLKAEFSELQSKDFLRLEKSYLEARKTYLNSRAKLVSYDSSLLETNIEGSSLEASYFNLQTTYLNAKDNLLKLEINSSDQDKVYLSSRSSYIDATKEFLRHEQEVLISEIKLLKKASPSKFKSDHIKSVNAYLDSIAFFLKAKAKFLDSDNSYSDLASNLFKSKVLYSKAKETHSKSESDYLALKEKNLNKDFKTLAILKANEAKRSSSQVSLKAPYKEAGIKSVENNKAYSAVKENLATSDDIFKNTNAWAQTFGVDANQKDLGDIDGQGYNSNTSGLILGVDAEVSKATRVGLALSFANSNIKSLDSLKRIGVETYQINAYSGHLFGNYFVDTIGAFALNEYKSSRAIPSVNATANASFSGQSYAAKIRGGFIKKFNRDFSLIPETSLMLANNSTNNYSENGAGTMNLDVRNNSSDFLEGRVGLSLNYKATTKNGSILTPQLKTSYGYDFVGKRQSIVSNFTGQPTSFVTTLSKYDPRSFRVGGAIDFYQLNAVTIGSEYTLEVKSKYQSHSALLSGTYKF